VANVESEFESESESDTKCQTVPDLADFRRNPASPKRPEFGQPIENSVSGREHRKRHHETNSSMMLNMPKINSMIECI
jgi:hypothetical protein